MYLQRKYQRYINNRHIVTKGKFKIIHQFDSNGNHIQSFNSIADARLKLNLKLSNIRDSANRRIKCEGFY